MSTTTIAWNGKRLGEHFPTLIILQKRSDSMEEIWRTVVYNGEIFDNYEISSYGRVRSLNYNHITHFLSLCKIKLSCSICHF